MSSLEINYVDHKTAKHAVMNWHYSKCMPIGKLVKYGVWENGNFIGVVIFGRGANKDLLTPYGLNQTQGCELVRIALNDHNIEVTRIIKICFSLLKKDFPTIKIVISFADPEQGHEGKIYKAGNWLYAGMSQGADEYYYNGKRWHGRAFRKRYGSHTKYNVKIIKGSKKHRYVYCLDKRLKQAMAETISTAQGQHLAKRSNDEITNAKTEAA